jgi:hypothetical protein
LDDIRLALTRIGDRDVLVGTMGNEATLVGEKLPVPAARDALFDYIGKYELVNKDMEVTPTDLAFRYEDGMFIAECAFAQIPGIVFRVGVNPISDSEALISGLGSSRGETIRLFKDKNGTHMVYSGMDMRKIN